MKRFGSRVKRENNKLFVQLNNGKWFQLLNNPDNDEAGHTFEYYFDDFGFYSIRVQMGEGNTYKLVNSETGEANYIIGRPFFHQMVRLLLLSVMTLRLDIV